MKTILCIFALAAVAMANSSLEKMSVANEQFTSNMFQEVAKSQAGKSFVQSAFSLYAPLAQLALASVGETHDEILEAIALPDDNVTKEVIGAVNKQLASIKGIELKQANKIYIHNNFELIEEFVATTKEIFDSEIQNIDFQSEEKAVADINAWVESHTNNRIKDLVAPDDIDPNTVAVLVNALYFKGKWAKPFKLGSARDGDFYITKDEKITVPLMDKTGDFKYSESKELDAKFLEMEYEGGEASFIIALPNEIDGITTLIDKLKEPTAMKKAVNDLSTKTVHVTVPKFRIETTTDLKDILQNLNIKTLFQIGKARLDHLLKRSKDLFISAATQKTFIEVNEEGTEASAANKVVIGLGSGYYPDAKTFEADHPFVFFLKAADNILFSGVYRA